MAGINKLISYRRGRPTGKGLADYLGKEKAGREKVLLLDGRGKVLTPGELSKGMEKPIDQASKARGEYSEWAKREGVSFRRDRAGNLILKGADGRELHVAQVEIDGANTGPDVDTLIKYVTKDKAGRERQALFDANGRILSPNDALRQVREAKANFWHGVTAPSEIGCAALMERYQTSDTEFAAVEHGKLLSERIAKLSGGDRPSFAIHWDSASKFHYHWIGIGEPKAVLAGENGVIQRAWDIEFEERSDRGRVKNWKAYKEWTDLNKTNIHTNRAMRELDNQKFKTLRTLVGDTKAAAKDGFNRREISLIERRFDGEVRAADLQYKAFGTQGSSRHLAELERAELRRRSALKRVAYRDLSYYDLSQANRQKQKEREGIRKEEAKSLKSEHGKALARSRVGSARKELEALKKGNADLSVVPATSTQEGRPQELEAAKSEANTRLNPFSVIERATQEAKSTSAHADESASHGKDQVEADQALDGAGLIKGLATGRGVGESIDRTAANLLTNSGSRETNVDAQAGVEGLQSFREIAKELHQGNVIAAASRAAGGATRVAGTTDRTTRELTQDLGKAFDLIINPLGTIKKSIDFEL